MKKIISLFFLLLTLLPSSAVAAELQTAKGNFYLAEANPTIASRVEGDLYVVAGTTLVSGTVAGDLVVVGGTVTVTGEVIGDLRVFGGNTVITGNVAGDVFVIGGSLIVNGRVVGDLDFIGGMLKIGDPAVVIGDLTYRSNREASISSQATIVGDILYDQTLARSIGVVKEAGSRSLISGFAALFGVWLFLKLLMLLLASLILFWLALPQLEKITLQTLHQPGVSLTTGLLTLVLTPMIGLALLISIVGLPLAFLVFFTYLILLLVAKLAAGIILGVWLDKIIKRRNRYQVKWPAVVGGTSFLFILSYLPVIGWFLAGLTALAVFGAMIDLLYRRWLVR